MKPEQKLLFFFFLGGRKLSAVIKGFTYLTYMLTFLSGMFIHHLPFLLLVLVILGAFQLIVVEKWTSAHF